MILDINSAMTGWLLKKKLRIIIFGIFIITIPLAGLSAFIYYMVNSEFKRIVRDENETFLRIAASQLEEKINISISNAKTFADRPLLVRDIMNGDRIAIKGHLSNFIGNSLTMERIIACTPDGRGVATYPDDQNIFGMNFVDTDWYRGVMAMNKPYVSDFFLRKTEPRQYIFAIAVPVRGPNGAMIGIIILHPKKDYFKKEIGEMKMGRNFIYIVDKKGHLIYHPGYSLDRIVDFAGVPAVGRVMKGLSGTEKNYDQRSGEYVLSSFRPMKWGWGVIVQRPEQDVMKPVNNVLAGLLVFTVISLLLGTGIAFEWTGLLYSIRKLSVDLEEKKEIEKSINLRLQAELVERKLAEEKLELTLEDLERSNKELEQFAYVASHDLQEPLRKVASFTELLERRNKGRLGDDADRYIEYIVDGAKRMSLLINDLLTFSRIGTKGRAFEKTDFNTVLAHAIDVLQLRIRESGATITADTMPVLEADSTQIGMVFQNLVANALKFRSPEPPVIGVSARRDGGAWIFSVRDNGIGIDAEYFERIFGMFQRLHSKAEYPGTGIGLAICKKVVERHGGDIWVESEPGKGSIFYFSIPDESSEVAYERNEER